MTIWFTSDLHLGQYSILQHTARAAVLGLDQQMLENFKSDPNYKQIKKDCVDIHDKWVIETINSFVKYDDELYILGDISFHSSKWKAAELIDRINGVKTLVVGNHDFQHRMFYESSGLFKTVADRLTITTRISQTSVYNQLIGFKSQKIILDHYPVAEWLDGHHGSWHLHGHTHGNFNYAAAGLDDKRILDVSLDSAFAASGMYSPFSMEQVEKFMNHESRKNISHHGKAD